MQLTEIEKKNIRATWVNREKRSREEKAELMQNALITAQKAAAFLRVKYNVNHIYLYGSLSRYECFDSLSDIDIFIEGWNRDHDFWKMLGEAEFLAKPFHISIVTHEEASSSLINEVYKEGRLLL